MQLRIEINEALFVRDPQETDLGKRILEASIAMIDELGMESFTFKKLAEEIDSTEASIYRYFENKHRLLIYLITWYWNWLEYQIIFWTQNIESPEDRLAKALKLITEQKENDEQFPIIDEKALQRIIINESDKAYLTKHVDLDNNTGAFLGYKTVCERIAQIVLEINPEYQFAHSLISTSLEAAHQQIFFSQHLQRLSDIQKHNGDPYQSNYEFLLHLITKTISK